MKINISATRGGNNLKPWRNTTISTPWSMVCTATGAHTPCGKMTRRKWTCHLVRHDTRSGRVRLRYVHTNKGKPVRTDTKTRLAFPRKQIYKSVSYCRTARTHTHKKGIIIILNLTLIIIFIETKYRDRKEYFLLFVPLFNRDWSAVALSLSLHSKERINKTDETFSNLFR